MLESNEIAELAEGIRQAAIRSAWKRVLSPPGTDADAINRDPGLLRLNWSEKDAQLIEKITNEPDDSLRTLRSEAYDRGKLSFNDFIDIFFAAKQTALLDIRKGIND